MQDYGGPVGFAWPWPTRTGSRLSSCSTLLRTTKAWEANWNPRRAFWADRASNESALRTNLLSLPTTRTRHVGNDPNVERYAPDLSTDEFAFLSHSGEPEHYRKDVPKAQVHVLNAGHFALDTAADEIASLVQNFVGSSHNDGA